ncbi:hypothetical protein ACVIHI_002578 [Bradyrhizobium sp. USDA 4524]|uniref:hypothetical protein n=1 Tax=unclassified Bradyrhizobium TaxID=2631580 RepID=UPI00209CCFD1|nr:MULTISPECIES: hypothetical protein [unclassified Bradyrhizobium]MCP1844500.1 hypothetical protein [Bradyrhizobium sp. USDA 4538]MCP1905066.1 hypothetical protein [Bradyrhizobium sp. USDA 4537]MCP1989278.1 hypothetical protein [Bradyrhizobium sp. USDA 4539]
MTDSNLVAQLNANWRVMLLHDEGAWRCAAWSIEQLSDDGAWRGRYAVRTHQMLLDVVQYRCGTVDPAAAAILATLPAYSYRRVDGEPPPRHKLRKAITSQEMERKPVASVISEEAKRFVDWRKGRPRR